jgi:hypothetical protein
MPYFGMPWPSGLCETEENVPVPVGKLCFECDEPIEEDHQGTFYYANNHIDQCMDKAYLVWVPTGATSLTPSDLMERPDLSDQVAMNPVHKECGFRAVSGGIGHFEDHHLWCQTRHDPDGGRTRRQSALEVWARTVRMTHSQEN